MHEYVVGLGMIKLRLSLLMFWLIVNDDSAGQCNLTMKLKLNITHKYYFMNFVARLSIFGR